MRKLLGEEVNFVQEQNLQRVGIENVDGEGRTKVIYHRGLDKPPRVTYGFKECESFLHPVLRDAIH